MMFTTTLAMVTNWCESLTMCQAAPDKHCSMLDQCCPLEKILLIPHVWNLEFSGLGTSKDFELKVSRVKIIISLFLTPDYKLLTWPFTNQPFASTPLATATDFVPWSRCGAQWCCPFRLAVSFGPWDSVRGPQMCHSYGCLMVYRTLIASQTDRAKLCWEGMVIN